MKKVCVIGLGYIGLPTASLLATKGFEVLGVDVNKEVVNTINNGEIHIYEPDLDILVKAATQSGKLKASTSAEKADIFILAVPTPFKENKQPDLSYVEEATRSIAGFLEPNNLIILESTSPVGTTDKIAEWVGEIRKDLKIPYGELDNLENDNSILHIAHCPERVLPGHILKELVENDRIIGGVNPASTEIAVDFYNKFVTGELLITDSKTAEMAKLTENAYRDVNIAFANELSMISEELSINVWELINLANHHPRVDILQPGPGVGGHCIAVDPWFIIDSSPQTSNLIRSARNVNTEKPKYVIEKVIKKASKFKNPKIACLGLAFKANIGDLRESPSVEIVKTLADNINEVYVVEPYIDELPLSLKNCTNLTLKNMEESVNDADIILILVEHKQFYKLNNINLKDKIVIDIKGVIE